MIKGRTALLIASLISVAGVAEALPKREAGAPAYRDLNHNGRMDVYEDRRATHVRRVRDLLSRMTVEEKVGTLLHGTLPAIDNPFGASAKGYDLPAIGRLIQQRQVTSMISRLTASPVLFAEQNNAVQRLAQATRLGIPITISTDPRNHFSIVAGASNDAAGFSQWPEPLGFAALGDPAVVRRFASLARMEYRSVGLHMALSPQADLASEPRWSRTIATFGADPAAVSSLAGAYVAGFQGGEAGVKADGVAAVAKHWVGYGAEPQGLDAHNYYGREVSLSNESFADHLAAFKGVLAARAAGVMPTYAVVRGVDLDGRPLEPVGAGFNEQLIDGLLRGRFGYDGLVISDWGIVNDCPQECRAPTAAAPQGPQWIGMPWGVEKLTPEQRVAKGVNAGIDQFGGLDDPAPILAAVRDGLISAQRLDQSVSRVLLLKFRLGLFDDPFVDPNAVSQAVGSLATAAEAERVQARALVLLKNQRATLPVRAAGMRIWLHGIDPVAARAAGFEPVLDRHRAEAALVRLGAPSERLHPHHFFGAMQHEGSLEYRDDDPGLRAIASVPRGIPLIAVVDLDRPAILGKVQARADALIVAFGASDRAILDAATGRIAPEGRLPVELPRDMTAVVAQKSDRPDDSVSPLYPRGAGLRLRSR